MQELIVFPQDQDRENDSTVTRVKKGFTSNSRVYMDLIGQPRGIPDLKLNQDLSLFCHG